jgi:hypothetical protein
VVRPAGYQHVYVPLNVRKLKAVTEECGQSITTTLCSDLIYIERHVSALAKCHHIGHCENTDIPAFPLIAYTITENYTRL